MTLLTPFVSLYHMFVLIRLILLRRCVLFVCVDLEVEFITLVPEIFLMTSKQQAQPAWDDFTSWLTFGSSYINKSVEILFQVVKTL